MDLLDPPALAAYLARIGVDLEQPGDDAEIVAAITWAHVQTIPFENLDLLLGRGIRLDLPALVAKLVTARRGGYCFEHGTLLAAALRALGFTVTARQARVRWGVPAGVTTARSHMLLAVELAGRAHLVDVGFGGQTPTAPIPLEPGEYALHHDRYRLAPAGRELSLQISADGGWTELYVFADEPAPAIDVEVANHFTSTHPSSQFLAGPRIARTDADGRIALRGAEHTRRRGAEVERATITDADAYLAVLARDFGLTFPPGTRFRGGPG